jgi:hypothetical protein
MNTNKKERLAEIDGTITNTLTTCRRQMEEEMKILLIPYGRDGVELNYHSEGCYRPMCELHPNQFSVINSLRYYNDVLAMQIDDDSEWVDFSMPCDIHFLWNELVETLDYLYENEEEDFVMYFKEYEKVWSNYGSFNELLGCAKIGQNDTYLALDVDTYNNNEIACYIIYKGVLGVEFTYLHQQDKPFKVTKVSYNNRYIDYNSYKHLL